MEIIVRSFKPHYNQALGKVVTSQRQYNEEIKRGGYIPYEECQQRVDNNLAKQAVFGVSDEAKSWMRDVQASADKKGNVRLSDRQIDVLKSKGQTVDRRLPEHYAQKGVDKGGFE